MSEIDYSKKTYKYTNESFSGCDMTAAITIRHLDKDSGQLKNFTYVLGELQTMSYSINMDKAPVRSIGNVNAKDFVMGQRTVAGSIVFNVFNRHFSKELMEGLNAGYGGGDSYLVDEIPPFDVTLSAANEYGYRSKLCIFGIRLLNEGQVMSVNDVFVENTYQFYATDVDYLDDEMKYARNKNGLYYLKDNVAKWYAPTETTLTGDIKWYAPQHETVGMDNPLDYDNYGYVADDTITLSSSVKQPAGDRKDGIVEFYIVPGIQEGKVVIKEEGGEVTQIGIKAEIIDPNADPGENPWYKENKKSHVNKKLPPGIYTAHAESNDNRKSNYVKFSITELKKEDLLKKYAPVIKNILNTSIIVMSMEPLHDKVRINTGYSSGSGFQIHDLVNGQCTIEGLSPETVYTISTFDSDEGLYSADTTILTKSEKNSSYKTLGKLIYSNSSLLVYTGNTKRYLEILELAYEHSNNTNEEIRDALLYIKRDLIKKYNEVEGSGNIAAIDKAKLDIKMISEIIGLQNNLSNKEKVISNKESFTAPIAHFDENYNMVFEFHKDTTFAEFYKTTGRMNYFKQGVEAGIFKEIEDKKNCFRYIGEHGTDNYVEALCKDKRSIRLDFYIMTSEERQDYSQNSITKDRVPERLLRQYSADIKKDLGNQITDSEESQALINRIKKIRFSISAPTIEKKEHDLLIDCCLTDLDVADTKNKYYYCIGNLDEVVNVDMIYKIPFMAGSAKVTLSLISYNLDINKEYGCWVENNEFEQISNSTAFVFNNEDKSDLITEYELTSNFDSLFELARRSKIYIENNSFINNNNIVISLLNEIACNGITYDNFASSIEYIKKHIGINAEEVADMMTLVHAGNKIIITPEEEVVVTIYTPHENNIKSKMINDETIFTLNDGFNIVVCANKSLNKKSSIYLIDKERGIRRINNG